MRADQLIPPWAGVITGAARLEISRSSSSHSPSSVPAWTSGATTVSARALVTNLFMSTCTPRVLRLSSQGWGSGGAERMPIPRVEIEREGGIAFLRESETRASGKSQGAALQKLGAGRGG